MSLVNFRFKSLYSRYLGSLKQASRIADSLAWIT